MRSKEQRGGCVIPGFGGMSMRLRTKIICAVVCALVGGRFAMGQITNNGACFKLGGPVVFQGKTWDAQWSCVPDVGVFFDRIDFAVGKDDQLFELSAALGVCAADGTKDVAVFKAHKKDVNPGDPLYPHHEVWSVDFTPDCNGKVLLFLQAAEHNEPIIDADGTASAGDGIPGAVEVTCGDPLASFPVSPHVEGLDWFDSAPDGQWTFGASGDDLHAEDPAGSCPTGIRNGIHDLGFDCKVLDINGSLVNGAPVSCDLGKALGCPATLNNIRYHDLNGDADWNSGEDIVLDANGNAIYDCAPNPFIKEVQFTHTVSKCPAGAIDFGFTPNDSGVADVSGTPLNTQYVFTRQIVFGGAVDSERPETIVTNNGACRSNPRSSGVPIFATDWWAQFNRGTGPGVPGLPAFVTTFSAEVCFIDGPAGAVLLNAYGNEKELIASVTSTTTGTETLTVNAPPGGHIAYVQIVSSADPAGLSIDCLQYDKPQVKPKVPTVTAWGMAALILVPLTGIAVQRIRKFRRDRAG